MTEKVVSKMFTFPDSGAMTTWNPYVGCEFNCYNGGCWARHLAETRLKHLPQYRDGFHPHWVGWKGDLLYSPRFKADSWVFVCSMGDISFATNAEFRQIRDVIKCNSQTHFLLQSKNPKRFQDWVPFPENVWLGTTIETNRDTSQWSKAPLTENRWMEFYNVDHPHKLVSIEPIMDMDTGILASWVKFIRPEIVFVGADSRHNNLPEPSWDKVQELLTRLREFLPQVIEKAGLERLKK